MHDIIVIGGGPAGLTAALYAKRSGKSVLVLEKEGYGGQIAFSPRVENYPGIPVISGEELAENMLDQILNLDVDTDVATVTAVEKTHEGYRLLTEDGESHDCRAVILAAGVKHRHLGLPGELELIGQGISFCAVCDGGFYQDRDVAVVGGGDTALQEALLLTDVCEHVYIIHRRDSFRGEKTKQDKLFRRCNAHKITNSRVTELLAPKGELEGIVVEDLLTGETRTLAVEALFVAVGLVPELGAFANVVPLDEQGYAAVGEDCTTAVPGVFVAGDCRAKEVRQLTTAVADGACAALAACRYLDSL